MLLRLHDSFPVLSVSSVIGCIAGSILFFNVKEENLEDMQVEKRKGGACRDLGFSFTPAMYKCDSAASTDKKLIESKSSKDMKPIIDPNGKIVLCILVILACATDETKLW